MKKYFYYLLIFICFACQMEEYDFSPHHIPALETIGVTEVKHNRVTLNARVNNDYGYPVTEKGFYYATTKEKLQIEDRRTVVINREVGKGDYNITIKRLTPNTIYYYLPFATNEQGTAVGQIINSFTTAPAVAPTILTSEEVSTTAYQLTFKATVPDDGGYPLTNYGFIYAIG